MSCHHHRLMEICSICHPPANFWTEKFNADFDALVKEAEAKSTAELKAHKEKESMPNTCKTMDFSALVEMVNRGMGVMPTTQTYVEYLGYTWKLRELKLEILTSGSRKLSVTLEPVDVSLSSLTVDLVTTGSWFSAQTIS